MFLLECRRIIKDSLSRATLFWRGVAGHCDSPSALLAFLLQLFGNALPAGKSISTVILHSEVGGNIIFDKIAACSLLGITLNFCYYRLCGQGIPDSF